MDDWTGAPPPEGPLPPVQNPATTGPVTSGSFQKPADYYATPPSPRSDRPGCPKWIPIGCGGAGCLVLILMILGTVYVMNRGAGTVLGFVFSRLEADMGKLMAKDVPQEKRDELQQQLDELKKKIARKEVGIVAVQPVLQSLQSAMSDQKLTAEEVDQLITSLRAINGEPEAAPSSTPTPTSL
ncbi:MAG: hypothetical protein ABI718_13565 [Acidobacteriota bacterium]